MNNNLYAIKGCNIKITHRKDKEYVLDYANEVHVESFVDSHSGKKSKMILIFCQMDDGFMKHLDCVDEIEIQNHVKYYKDGSDGIKTDAHYKMKFVYSSYILNYDSPTEFVYAFCDGDVKSGYIKKEINEILNRRQQNSIIDAIANLSMNISNNRYKIQQSLEDININELKQKLYFDVDVSEGCSKKVKANIYYNGEIYNIVGDFKFIAQYICNLIGDKNVEVHGDYHSFGMRLVDELRLKGIEVMSTKVTNLNMKRPDVINERILKTHK